MRAWFPLLTVAALFPVACTSVEPRGDAVVEGRAPVKLGETPKPPAQPVAGTLAAGTVLPAVPLRNLDDQPVRLEAAAGGKPALVSFWATWCEACLTEVDALNRLDERARSGGGVVIGVAVGEGRDKAAAFVREHGLRYAQLVDEKLLLADALGQKRLPATIVLDRQGRVVFVGGTLDEKALAAFRAAMSR